MDERGLTWIGEPDVSVWMDEQIVDGVKVVAKVIIQDRGALIG